MIAAARGRLCRGEKVQTWLGDHQQTTCSAFLRLTLQPEDMNMKLLRIVLLVLVLFAFPSSAAADVAPPINPPGSNPEPGTESTQVRMAAETVLIEVQSDTTPDSLGHARITADFTMHNTGASGESMAVRFPLSSDDGRGQYPEIQNLAVKVNGQQVSHRRASYPDPRYQQEDVPWAEFDVTFPAGADLPIQVAYDVNGSGYLPFTAFYYVMESGAGWKDTIGSADIILRLPYPASTQNVIMGLQIGWAETTPGGVIQGNEVRWHFENFEPGADGPVQNMEFALVAPSAWTPILKERDTLARTPDDGEAWGRLGKLYKGVFFMSKGYREDPGGEELYKLSAEAYEKCLALKPEDAQWHAGFADLLANRSYWDAWMAGPTPDTYRALEEIQTALKLAPNDAVVQAIAQNLTYLFPDGIKQSGNEFEFPWLTQTPTPQPPAPTIVPVYDPSAIAGTYQSGLFSLSNSKRLQLTVILNRDHSAEMESSYENDKPFVSNGSWTDNSDGKIILRATDPVMGPVEIWFDVESDSLKASQYPSLYEGGFELKRVPIVTPSPATKETPGPVVPSQNAPTPTPKPSSPLCGSAALIPLASVILLWKKRR